MYYVVIVMSKKHAETITFKVKPLLNRMIEKCVKRDTHFTKSSFIRNAVREKIRRDFENVWGETKND